MTNNAGKRQLLQSRTQASQPVTMTDVDVKSSGAAFFNINTGSKRIDAPFINFKPDKRETSNLKDKRSDRFTVHGIVK